MVSRLARVFDGDLLEATQSSYSLTLLLSFIAIALIHSIRASRAKAVSRKQAKDGNASVAEDPIAYSKSMTFFFRTATILTLLSYVANGILVAIHAAETHNKLLDPQIPRWGNEATLIYILGSTSFFLYMVVTLFDWRYAPDVPHFIIWVMAILGEVVMIVCKIFVVQNCTEVLTLHAKNEPGRACFTKWARVDFTIVALRIACLVGWVLLYAGSNFHWRRGTNSSIITPKVTVSDGQSSAETGESESESTPLLSSRSESEVSYDGTTTSVSASHPSQATPSRRKLCRANGKVASAAVRDETAKFYRPKTIPRRSWWEYLRAYTVFWPFLWPKDSVRLKIRIFVCFVLLILQRVVNIMLPYQIGKVTDQLSNRGSESRASILAHHMPWFGLWTLNFLLLVQGQAGLLGSARALIWVKVSQYSYKALQRAGFQHVHSLSLDFHTSKRTGEVLSALNKGGSINVFLEQVTFQLLPMLVDLFLAIYFFHIMFDAMYGTIVSINTFWYLFLTIKMAQTRVEQRRLMTNANRDEDAVKNDSITSYETVKYFNAEQYEFKRYDHSIDNFQKAEAKVTYGLNNMAIVQSLVFTFGLALALTAGAWQVSQGYRSVGDFVTLMSYLTQMQAPLNFFNQFYRTIQQALVSGERLLELFKIKPNVIDRPGAKELRKCEGHIRWNNVSFAYNEKGNQALRNVNFDCPPGTTTAFVGESGGGKSTIFRLMFRYYNTSEGSIEVDGKDVKDLTIDSVRRFIGVVPQETILFNETIMYNIKYANPKCSDEDVYDACRAASIHDRIMSFPEGYNTTVGDRGLRLSGGEKQRVAIARTILKNPKITLLDEATSALDSQTEQLIQTELNNLGVGRTMMIIAHRLSTITHADQIVVLHNGEVVEKGTHDELIARKGRYASMWDRQIQAERAAERARIASRHAKLLMRQANIPKTQHRGTGLSDIDGGLSSKDCTRASSPVTPLISEPPSPCKSDSETSQQTLRG